VKKTPKSVLNYFEKHHPNLKDDYRRVDGTVEVCGLLALDIAELLLKLGEKPEIIHIRGTTKNNGNYEVLSPLIFKSVTWGGHQVCRLKGMIFDPILSFPIEEKKYYKIVFDKKVQVSSVINTEKIKSMLFK